MRAFGSIMLGLFAVVACIVAGAMIRTGWDERRDIRDRARKSGAL